MPSKVAIEAQKKLELARAEEEARQAQKRRTPDVAPIGEAVKTVQKGGTGRGKQHVGGNVAPRESFMGFSRPMETPEQKKEKEAEQARYDRIEMRRGLKKLNIPEKDIRLLVDREDRWGNPRRDDTEPWVLLNKAMDVDRPPGVVMLAGLRRTGKTSAGCRYVAQHSRKKIREKWGSFYEWSPNLYIRASSYCQIPAGDNDEMFRYIKAKIVQMDDIGREGEETWKKDKIKEFFYQRDDFTKKGDLLIMTSNFGPAEVEGDGPTGIDQFVDRYGEAVMSRLEDWGIVWLYSMKKARGNR